MNSSPARPRARWRTLNALGRTASALGLRLITLEPGALRDEARRRTGLDDFGSSEYEDPLATYLQAVEHEGRPTTIGRWLARRDALLLLETRLRIRELEKRMPAIFEQPVPQPVFITGAPRSGTSLLHRLVGADPAHRLPLIWEALQPCPPPTAESHAADPRIDGIDRLMRLWTELAPGYQSIHELGATVPSECGMLMNGSALSDQLAISFRAPSYERLVFGPQANMAPAYRWHRKVLQVLQWRLPGRWVLKAPSHLHHLETLLDVYPDALLVQTHRDPLRVLPSVASLLQAQLRMRSDHVDVAALRLGLSGEGLAASLGRIMALRDTGRLESARIADVRYADLVRNPLDAVRRVYRHFRWPLDERIERCVGAAIARNPKDGHGTHRYSLDELPLDMAAERARFAAYQARYDVPSET
jgi:hypothetical protein